MSTVQPPPPEWDELDSDPALFASRPWLESMGHRIEGDHRYFIDSGGAEARTGFFGSVIHDYGITVSKNPWDILFSSAIGMRTLSDRALAEHQRVRAECPPRQDWFPALVLTYPGLECFGIGPGAAEAPALDRAIANIIDSARAEGVRTVAFMYVQPENGELMAALSRAGFARAPTALRANLTLPGQTFTDYLDSLHRRLRQEVRRARRRLADRGVSIRNCLLADADNGLVDSLVRLRAKHREKYGKKPDDEAERKLLNTFQQSFGDRVTVFYAAAGDRVIGFSLIVDAGAVHHAWTNGTDYGHPDAKNLYFELCYYAPVEAGYRNGMRQISFGYGAEDIKVRRGCTLDPVYTYVLAFDPPLARAAHRAAAALALD